MKRRFVYTYQLITPPSTVRYDYIGVNDNSSFYTSGNTWSWGNNTYGQLGNNTTVSLHSPDTIVTTTTKTFCEITGGYSFTAALTFSGEVWSWGYNNYGQFGDNSTISRRTPVSILGQDKTFSNISAGYQFANGIDTKFDVWSWGYNPYGQLGNGTVLAKCTPEKVVSDSKTFCSLSSGQYQAVALQSNGQVWTWGRNHYGQLGDNSVVCRCVPVMVTGTTKTFCQIGAGYSHSLAIDYLGKVWCWGYNYYGRLGNNSTTSRRTPVSILGSDKTFCFIDGGVSSSGAIDNNGQIWCWGYNDFGQLGVGGDIICCRTPTMIIGPTKSFIQMKIVDDHVVALEHNSNVWAWGNNDKGQIGIEDSKKCSPTSVIATNKTFCQISQGMSQYHEAFLDVNGKVYVSGRNNYGQLGINSIAYKKTPTYILGTPKTFAKIAGGDNHTIAIDLSGGTWCWGYNTNGQLGNNSTISRRTPVPVCCNVTFCQVSGGYRRSVAIDKFGQAWGWGLNDNGQLGDNSITNKSVPVSVVWTDEGRNRTFCQIEAGYDTTIALQYNGQVWAWGDNSTGELGINSTISERTPVSILGTPKTFCYISTNYSTVHAIDNSGGTWGWGYNNYGQIGDNSASSRRTPVSILGTPKTFCKVASGIYHTLGLDYQGQVWSWGGNVYGELGIGNKYSKRTPVTIIGPTRTFCEIAISYRTSFALDKHGKAWAWGINEYGQSGIGLAWQNYSPVQVTF